MDVSPSNSIKTTQSTPAMGAAVMKNMATEVLALNLKYSLGEFVEYWKQKKVTRSC